jgi:ketosteroid isomerase-like protein
MRKFKFGKMSLLVFGLLVFVAGCGRERALSPASPTVIATSPTNGSTSVLLNAIVTANFSSVMASATINTATFTVMGPGGTAVPGAVSYSSTTATFTPAVSFAANSVYVATITSGAQDPGGNALAANFVWSFTTGAPTVISTVPASGSTAVPVNTLVSATFSEAMNPATLNTATFTLTGPGATPVAGAVTYSGTAATFTPTAVLATSTLYTATVTTGAMDPAGAALAADFAWTFTTAPPPTVISTTPANGATAVAVNSPVSATFSETMDPATINATTFILTGPAATPVVGVVTYSGTTATFTPAAPLVNTTFTATITTGAKDPTGAPLASNFVWTFTSGSQPAVTSINPVNGATNVPLNQKITATFNTPMTASTILAPGTFSLALTGGGAAVPGAVSYDAPSNTAIFAPSSALVANTSYTATVTTAAQSSQGSALPANYVWNFTTGQAANAAAPQVSFTDPDTNESLRPSAHLWIQPPSRDWGLSP